MNNYLSKDSPRLLPLMQPLRGITRYGGSTVPIDVTDACHRSIFAMTRRAIPIGSVGGLALSLPETRDQVGLCIVTNFLEQSPHGFGIGAYVSALTTVSRGHWLRFCQGLCGADRGEAEHLREVRPLGSYRVLSFERALAPSTQMMLRAHGVEVVDLLGETDLLRLTIGQYTQLLVAELDPRSLRLLTRSLRSFAQHERPKIILLTKDDKLSHHLEIGQSVGASRVLHVPCSREMLVQRLLYALFSEPPVQTQLALTPRQLDSVEDSLATGAAEQVRPLTEDREIQQRFAHLEDVPVGQTTQFALAPINKSHIKVFLLRIARYVGQSLRLLVEGRSARRTAWHGAG